MKGYSGPECLREALHPILGYQCWVKMKHKKGWILDSQYFKVAVIESEIPGLYNYEFSKIHQPFNPVCFQADYRKSLVHISEVISAECRYLIREWRDFFLRQLMKKTGKPLKDFVGFEFGNKELQEAFLLAERVKKENERKEFA